MVDHISHTHVKLHASKTFRPTVGVNLAGSQFCENSHISWFDVKFTPTYDANI